MIKPYKAVGVFPNLQVSNRLDSNFARIPQDRKLYFQESLDIGQYVVMVTGTESELHRAETILRLKGIQGFYTYDPHQREVYPDSISTTQSPPLVKIIDLRN